MIRRTARHSILGMNLAMCEVARRRTRVQASAASTEGAQRIGGSYSRNAAREVSALHDMLSNVAIPG